MAALVRAALICRNAFENWPLSSVDPEKYANQGDGGKESVGELRCGFAVYHLGLSSIASGCRTLIATRHVSDRARHQAHLKRSVQLYQ